MLRDFFLDGSLEVPRLIHMSELNRLDDLALEASVVINEEANRLPEWPLVALGRAPELYPPARSLLHGIKNQDRVAAIVTEVSRTPLWPTELAPDVFRSADTSARLIGSLVEIADRCGQFEKLLDTAAVMATDSTAGQLLQIYRTLKTIWKAPPKELAVEKPQSENSAE